jgi:cobalt-zinc-cadmium efflux system outer membrane protein
VKRYPGRHALLVVVALALAVPAAPRATDPGPLPALRWPELVAAVDRHPLLLEAAARERAAAGAVSTAGAIPNPTFSVAAGAGRPRDGGATRRELGYSVELPLEFLATRGPRVDGARAAQEGTRQEARVVRLQLTRELRRTFVAAVHGQAVVEAGDELAGQAAQLASLVRRRAERGEGRPTEVPRVEIELERLRNAVERARSTVEAQRLRLSTWLGAPVIRVEADLAAPLPIPQLPELQERLLASSPAVQAARARLQAAIEAASVERWERLPRLSIGAAHVDELDRTANTVTASVTLPLWNWNQGRIRQAEAAEAGERARLDATSRELQAGLSDAWRGCAAGQAAAVRFRDEILPRAQGSARTLGRAFELGEAGLLDVIDARRVLLDTRREYLDLLLDMQNACADLAALAGLELP